MVNDDVDGELLEQGRELFRDLGVNNPEPGETYDIPVGDSAEFQVLESDIEDVTPRYREIANSLPRRGNERIINTGYARPLCNILGCNTLSLIPGTCSKTVEDFIDPQISIDNKPKRIPNAEVQLNALPGGQPPLIQGEVQIDGSNFSEPGEVIEKTEYKCSSETEEEKEIIDESAIVSMD